ncbi:MotA/TolQ/ExbB proton channel family protein [Mucisphaera calidilacus]|uniref:Colicin uptake protein TolQ n=1 Tax=Mucisphaera calidilacus TaxID=2527982 RepID=A0A518BUE0_9BACT|nr:MotA/TolQ/ExbB proton channel family protein [Mucisphaera calidilacus]QDU70600.1 colicin uptake protein TolQ [Mucisphaera calidilacus]
MITLSQLQPQLQTFWTDATQIWLAGGWAMIAIAVVAMVLFAVGMHIYLRLKTRNVGYVKESTWRTWIDKPDERYGLIGEHLDFVSGITTLEGMTQAFDELRTKEITPYKRDLRVMRICVSAAPLLGLLGTVTGMLNTFGALASGSGADATIDLVAGGISEALITTETGLVIAIPGLFFQYHLSHMIERYQAFLAHMETACMQRLYRKLSSKTETRPAA